MGWRSNKLYDIIQFVVQFVKPMISERLSAFMSQQVSLNGETIFNYAKDVVAIGGKYVNGEKDLNRITTNDSTINFRYQKAREIVDFPDIIRFDRCPHVTLLCKGGLLLDEEEPDSTSKFTPHISIYFWTVAFTGENFKSVGLHQWKAWSWGIPEEKDIVELDRWNIPGELAKENKRWTDIANAVIEAIKKDLL